MSAYPHCKPGCILQGPDEGYAHRTPIDCTTVDDLWKSIDRIKLEIDGLKAENTRLKAEVYDLERREE